MQSELKKSLELIFGHSPTMVVAGRTDRGVHAEGQVVNFLSAFLISPDSLKKALNGLLPHDMRVRAVETVPFDFHARKSAKSREYRYWFAQNLLDLPVFVWEFVEHFPYTIVLDDGKIFESLFLGCHDFEWFKCAGSPFRSLKKTIIDFQLHKIMLQGCSTGDGLPVYEVRIVSDGFLYKMMRNIVGSIWEVMKGVRTIEELKNMIQKEKPFRYKTAGPKGLTLVKVNY